MTSQATSAPWGGSSGSGRGRTTSRVVSRTDRLTDTRSKRLWGESVGGVERPGAGVRLSRVGDGCTELARVGLEWWGLSCVDGTAPMGVPSSVSVSAARAALTVWGVRWWLDESERVGSFGLLDSGEPVGTGSMDSCSSRSSLSNSAGSPSRVVEKPGLGLRRVCEASRRGGVEGGGLRRGMLALVGRSDGGWSAGSSGKAG